MKFKVHSSDLGYANFQVSVNGFVISAAMGPAQYSNATKSQMGTFGTSYEATEIELAVIRESDGNFVTKQAWLDCFDEKLHDDVAGWRDTECFFNLVKWAENQ